MTESETEHGLKSLGAEKMIHGRYKIERELGAGAQAIVYLAQDVHLLRPAAVKLFSVMDGKLLDRFTKEAHLMASLDHPGIVKVYASGATEEGQHFIAMEYVDGGSLKDMLQQQNKLTGKEFAEIFFTDPAGASVFT